MSFAEGIVRKSKGQGRITRQGGESGTAISPLLGEPEETPPLRESEKAPLLLRGAETMHP